MCSIFKDKDQDLKLVLLFWFLPLMVGGYQGKVSLIRASLKYFHIWTKLVEAAKFCILRVLSCHAKLSFLRGLIQVWNEMKGITEQGLLRSG